MSPESVSDQLVVEFQSEEIPTQAMAGALASGIRALTSLLRKAHIIDSEAEADVTGAVGPRRLVFVATGLRSATPERQVTRKGPAVTAPQSAISAFLASVGLSDIRQCTRVASGKTQAYQAVITVPAESTRLLLDEVINALAKEITWPKTMMFADESLRWIRPLTGVAAVFAAQTVPGGLIVGGTRGRLDYSNLTYGHRFMGHQALPFSSFAEYVNTLAAHAVIVDQSQRKDKIATAIQDYCQQHGYRAVLPPAFLDELSNLCEVPTVAFGDIPQAYMTLPAELIATVLRVHVRCVSFYRASREQLAAGEVQPPQEMAPVFACVLNRPQDDAGIRQNLEKVLVARLNDALFFWNKDLETPLETHAQALDNVIFHKGLGTLKARAKRLKALARQLATSVYRCAYTDIAAFLQQPQQPWCEHATVAAQAGALAKADLPTLMVAEFPELQGVIGGAYARAQGKSEPLVAAVSDHYAPRGPREATPTAPVTVLVALADKLDWLIGLWIAGHKPTGSGDPYALRRAAIGIIRLCLDNAVAFSLVPLIMTHTQRYLEQLHSSHSQVDPTQIAREITHFLRERTAVFLSNKDSVSPTLPLPLSAQAVRAMPVLALDVMSILGYAYVAAALAAIMDTPIASQLSEMSKRIANILVARDTASMPVLSDTELDSVLGSVHWQTSVEADLYAALSRAEFICAEYGANHGAHQGANHGVTNTAQALPLLAALQPTLAAFFDQVLVDCDDLQIRQQRRSLLAKIQRLLSRYGNFSTFDTQS